MIHDLVVDLVTASAVAVLAVYLVVNGYYLVVHVAGVFELRDQLRRQRFEPPPERFDSPFLPGVAILVPAYNEAATIVDSVRSLLDVNYPDTTLVVINDGSTDDTLGELRRAYDLELIHERPPWDLECAPVRGVYRSRTVDDLLVVDKENGGKSDALNAGIGLVDQPLFCSVDADSLIDRDGLRRVVVPFLRRPAETVAAGGIVRVANPCEIDGGQVVDVDVSDRPLVGLQEVEYLRAFYSGRLGHRRLGSLLVISGTFGVFRTDHVRAIGGYSTDTVTEDLDLVVRLHRHLLEREDSYRVAFVPDPVVWTQVPETLADLSRQRRRWYRGLLQVFARNRGMVGNPRYGAIGTVVMPLFFLAEAVGPLLETYGYVVVPVAFLLGVLDVAFFATFLLVIVGVGVFLSWFSVWSEVWSYRRYDRPRQVATLLAYAVLENVGYRQWKALVSVRGLAEFLRDETGWGEMTRRPFSRPPRDRAENPTTGDDEGVRERAPGEPE